VIRDSRTFAGIVNPDTVMKQMNNFFFSMHSF